MPPTALPLTADVRWRGSGARPLQSWLRRQFAIWIGKFVYRDIHFEGTPCDVFLQDRRTCSRVGAIRHDLLVVVAHTATPGFPAVSKTDLRLRQAQLVLVAQLGEEVLEVRAKLLAYERNFAVRRGNSFCLEERSVPLLVVAYRNYFSGFRQRNMQIGVGRAALQIEECLVRLLDEDEKARNMPSCEHIFTARV